MLFFNALVKIPVLSLCNFILDIPSGLNNISPIMWYIRNKTNKKDLKYWSVKSNRHPGIRELLRLLFKNVVDNYINAQCLPAAMTETQ